MTSVTDENVFNLAVEGTFDDCQVRCASSGSEARLIIRPGHRQGALLGRPLQQRVPPRRH